MGATVKSIIAAAFLALVSLSAPAEDSVAIDARPAVTPRELAPVDQAPCSSGQAWTGTIICDKGTRSAAQRIFAGYPGVEVCMVGSFSCQPIPNGPADSRRPQPVSVQDVPEASLAMVIWNYEAILR
jgi:hypothetical protein